MFCHKVTRPRGLWVDEQLNLRVCWGALECSLVSRAFQLQRNKMSEWVSEVSEWVSEVSEVRWGEVSEWVSECCGSICAWLGCSRLPWHCLCSASAKLVAFLCAINCVFTAQHSLATGLPWITPSPYLPPTWNHTWSTYFRDNWCCFSICSRHAS